MRCIALSVRAQFLFYFVDDFARYMSDEICTIFGNLQIILPKKSLVNCMKKRNCSHMLNIKLPKVYILQLIFPCLVP